jgi:hypothetical protein
MRWWSDGGAVWAAPRPCAVRERAGKVGEATSAKEGGGGDGPQSDTCRLPPWGHA